VDFVDGTVIFSTALGPEGSASRFRTGTESENSRRFRAVRGVRGNGRMGGNGRETGQARAGGWA